MRRSPGAQCSCIRLEQPYTRLVLPTFAAGSDVSVVIKHEIQFVLGIFNRHSWSHELLFGPGNIVLAEHKVMFNFIYLFELYRSTALTL